VTGESGEAVWELLLAGSGPFKSRAASLEPAGRERLHAEFVEFLESHRSDGGIRVPAPYLLVLGTRR
jgi:hypothetical protein